MSQRNRYFAWRGIARFDAAVDCLIKYSEACDEKLKEARGGDRSVEQTVVENDFAVVFVTFEEIDLAFRKVDDYTTFEDFQFTIRESDKITVFREGAGFLKQPGQQLLGADVPISLAEYAGTRNVSPGAPAFDRKRAEALINADAARVFGRNGSRKVNVVIFDGGLDKAYLQDIGYTGTVEPISGLGGKKAFPHLKESERHANAVARSVISIAPDVQLIDAPILPPDRIDDVNIFSWRVVLLAMDLLALKKTRPDESWVLVCAWGLMDRKFDNPLFSYADDKGHFLSFAMEVLVSLGVDIVFSAGNNGMFSPDLSSGHTDRGPLRSIIGSNGLRAVLTVGGVDPLGRWIGGSSQGPEPGGMRSTVDLENPRKPDVCAPTWFRETDDRSAGLTGTSGACAVAAGVVAAVRKSISAQDLPPVELIDTIRSTARHEGYTGGDDRDKPAELRLGSGIIDCDALVTALGAAPPSAPGTIASQPWWKAAIMRLCSWVLPQRAEQTTS